MIIKVHNPETKKTTYFIADQIQTEDDSNEITIKCGIDMYRITVQKILHRAFESFSVSNYIESVITQNIRCIQLQGYFTV